MPENIHEQQLIDQRTTAEAERKKITDGLKNLADTIKQIREEEGAGETSQQK